MMRPLTDRFGSKVFIAFAVFIFIISLSFTSFFIHNQTQSLTNTLIRNGMLLSRLLAYNSRIGIFFENNQQLTDLVDGILQQEGVLGVFIYDEEGRLLKSEQKNPSGTSEDPFFLADPVSLKNNSTIFHRLQSNRKSFYLETQDTFEFWSPVISGSGYSVGSSLFFEELSASRQLRLIGFVQIKVDKTGLETKLTALLMKSILMGVMFLMFGSVVSYFMVKSITRPLNRLIEGVTSLGRKGTAEAVPVETKDEIGQLARAFNTMSASLMKREESLRESEKRLRSLSSRLLNAQEHERRRISRELHDGLGQALAIMKHRLRSIERNLDDDHVQLRGECEESKEYLNQIIEDVRRLSRDLSPSILEDLGLTAALRWLLENFAQQYDIETTVDIENIDSLFSREAQTNLYRVSQEILTNIHKHAHAHHVRFVVENESSYIRVKVTDDGKGFDPEMVLAENVAERGMGLDAMQERAHMLNARLDIQSDEDRGTRITLTVPCPAGGTLSETIPHHIG